MNLARIFARDLVFVPGPLRDLPFAVTRLRPGYGQVTKTQKQRFCVNLNVTWAPRK